MISFGLTLQNNNKIPKEVADWVQSRNQLFPEIDFRIDGPHPVNNQNEKELIRKYSRFYSMFGGGNGVLNVTFPYLEETWSVRIIGSETDQAGNLTPLSAQKRNEIAEFDIARVEKLGKIYGLSRQENSVKNKPTEYTIIEPDGRMTSEFSIKGKDFQKAIDQRDDFRVLSYNNPDSIKPVGLMEAINQAADTFEAQSLTYKLIASAELLKQKLIPTTKDGAQLVYGSISHFSGKDFRIDLLVNLPGNKEIIVRFLAKKERLPKEEYFFIESLLEDDLIIKLLIIYQAEISPLDDIFFKRLSGKYQKLIVQHIIEIKE